MFGVQFPVVKTTNNTYYLTHSFDKSYNRAGWIFMDYENKMDGQDKNIVIYGHNRKDGSMFAPLKQILKPAWYNNEANKYVTLLTEDEKLTFEVFSIYRVENEMEYITINFDSENAFRQFKYKMQQRSVKDYDIDVTVDAPILTLSTCDDNNDYRIVLHAIKVETTPNNVE